MDPLPSSSSYPHSYLPPYPFQEHPFYLPIILYLYTFSTDSLPHPNAPIHIVYWACPPTPHFRFFGLFLAISLLSALSPTILYPLLLFIKALHSLPGPSHPPAPACPHFRFFERFFDVLLHVFLSHFVYTCTYIIISIE